MSSMFPEAASVARKGGAAKPVPSPLSGLFWRIDWGRHFPRVHPGTGATAERSDFQSTSRFLLTHHQSIYMDPREPQANNLDPLTEAKQDYYEQLGDLFLFKAQGKTVGCFLAAASDWSTYYFRNATLLPEFQDRGILQWFMLEILDILKNHGVERVEVDTSPLNHRVVHYLNKHRFQITGISNSERWGSLLRFTRFLSSAHGKVFRQQFGFGAPPPATGH